MESSGLRRDWKRLGVALAMAIGLTIGGSWEPTASQAIGQEVYTGVEALGLANWTSRDIESLANNLTAVGGRVEAAFMPFEFNPANPFGNATALAQLVLPRIQGKLRLTVYLYSNDLFDPVDPPFRWDAFRAQTPNADQKAFINLYLRRVQLFDFWTRDLRAWALKRKLTSKLDIWLCPYLQDNSGSLADYNALLVSINGQQARDRVFTSYRRSPGASIFRPSLAGRAIPIEMHGRYDDVLPFLKAGDTYSNLGNFVFFDRRTVPGSFESQFAYWVPGDIPLRTDDFLFRQRDALKRKISVNFWRPVYSGLIQYPSFAFPIERVGLTPLSDPYSDQPENTAVIQILRSR